jgi:hypothetical protein
MSWRSQIKDAFHDLSLDGTHDVTHLLNASRKEEKFIFFPLRIQRQPLIAKIAPGPLRELRVIYTVHVDVPLVKNFNVKIGGSPSHAAMMREHHYNVRAYHTALSPFDLPHSNVRTHPVSQMHCFKSIA